MLKCGFDVSEETPVPIISVNA